MNDTDTAGIAAVMSEAEIRQWIDACNHEPARAALRELLAARQEIGRLTEALKIADDAIRLTECPRPYGGKDMSADCFAAGQCGCCYGTHYASIAALSPKEPR